MASPPLGRPAVAVFTGHSNSPRYLRLQKKSFLQKYEVVPHGKEAFSPAPASCVASAHMGPRVFGFSNPGHRFPPGPVQPGLINRLPITPSNPATN
eukprot:2858478-Amphidinium_carterae.1